jgi:hypothetical protein
MVGSGYRSPREEDRIPSKRVTGAIFGARPSRRGEQAVKARSTLTTILAIWSAESGRAGAAVAIYLE